MHKKSIRIFSISLILTVFVLPFCVQSVESKGQDSEKKVYLPILMYHEIKSFGARKDVIYPSEFESDLKYLTAHNYASITMNQLIAYVFDGVPLPENPIILSFDDGYLNTYVYALPLLKKYNMKIVFSIIGKNTDDFTNIPDSNLDYSHVTWAQLNEMLQSGCVEVQNHSYNLHKMNRSRQGCCQSPGESLETYEKVLTNDLGKLQNKIISNTGVTPTAFAYPYGLIGKNTDTILKKLGFKATLSCIYGVNVITHNPEVLFRLKRICRAHNQPISRLLAEAYKTVKYKPL